MLSLLSTALLASSIFLPTTNAMQCTHTVNGKLYDLTPLSALGDTKISPAVGAYDYYINVCGAVSGPCASHPGAFSCQVRKSPADQFEAVVAYSDTNNHAPEPSWGPSASETGGVKLTFTNGDACNLRQRVLNVDFQCDESGTRSISIDENPQCTFNIIYPTQVVCPGYVPPTTAAPTTAAPTTDAPTYLPTTAAPTTHAPTSTPTSASSTYDENTITRAGLGAGIGIGVGCLAIVWLLWCCYDRRRVQQQVQADAYAPLTSSSV